MKEREIYVICDNLRSLYNVGSIFRTSDALGVKKIYLLGITGTPPQKGIAKVALGAEQSVPWEQIKRPVSLIKKLKKQGIKIAALEQSEKSLDFAKFKPKFPLAIILGNEVDGVSKKLLAQADNIVHLPQAGIKESLNVSVAFGIFGYWIKYKK